MGWGRVIYGDQMGQSRLQGCCGQQYSFEMSARYCLKNSFPMIGWRFARLVVGKEGAPGALV